MSKELTSQEQFVCETFVLYTFSKQSHVSFNIFAPMTLCSKESCNPMTMEVLAFLSLFSKSAKSLAGLTFTPNTMLGSSLSSNNIFILNFHLPYKLSDDKCKPLWSHNLLTDWGLQLPCKKSATTKTWSKKTRQSGLAGLSIQAGTKHQLVLYLALNHERKRWILLNKRTCYIHL